MKRGMKVGICSGICRGFGVMQQGSIVTKFQLHKMKENAFGLSLVGATCTRTIKRHLCKDSIQREKENPL